MNCFGLRLQDIESTRACVVKCGASDTRTTHDQGWVWARAPIHLGQSAHAHVRLLLCPTGLTAPHTPTSTWSVVSHGSLPPTKTLEERRGTNLRDGPSCSAVHDSRTGQNRDLKRSPLPSNLCRFEIPVRHTWPAEEMAKIPRESHPVEALRNISAPVMQTGCAPQAKTELDFNATSGGGGANKASALRQSTMSRRRFSFCFKEEDAKHTGRSNWGESEGRGRD